MINITKLSLLLKNRREELNLTQKDVSNIININISTLWRIENGQTLASFETLSKLCAVYDLNIEEYLRYLFDDTKYSMYYIKKEIEKIISDKNYPYLNDYIDLLEKINLKGGFLNKIISSYILFLKGIIELDNKNYYDAKNCFFSSYRVLNKNKIFEMSDKYYNDFEIRILMNLSLTYHYLGDIKKYKETLTFCKNYLNKNSDLQNILNYNYAIMFYRINEIDHSINYINKTIDLSVNNNNLLILSFYHLSNCYKKNNSLDEYKKNINKCQVLCDIYNPSIIRKIINKKLSLYNISNSNQFSIKYRV